MTAVAADQNVELQPTGRNQYDILTTATIYAGAMVGVDAAGFLKVWADVAADEFIGFALTGAVGLTASPAGTDTKCPVNDEGGILKNILVASAVQGSVGEDVFCTTDNVLENCVLSGATSRAIGRIIRFISAGVADIEIYSATTFAAAES